jgi:hypothetical protein
MEAINYIEKELNLKTEEDWYRVSRSILSDLGVTGFLVHHGGLYKCLKKARPSVDWQEKKFSVNLVAASKEAAVPVE